MTGDPVSLPGWKNLGQGHQLEPAFVTNRMLGRKP